MKATSGVRMVTGNGENSYSANSRLQEKAILETRTLLRKAIQEIYSSIISAHPSTIVVVDLGCSSGPNTLGFISEVITAIRTYSQNSEDDAATTEVQFFLNDLPGNDFNLLFRSLEHYNSLGGGKEMPSYYVAGLPGSYYRHLFPSESVHLFHSSYSLHWRSKGRVVKEKLDSFNVPYYVPSVKEVKALIKKNSLYDIEHIGVFESNWDPQDDSESDRVLDSAKSAANVAKCIRAVLEPLIVDHFGKEIVEELFVVYASNVAKHLEKAKAKYPIIIVSLKKPMN
uniref:Uncharacterized protein n=1 Tax=Avena sativa TaxID=4498 RepID=A0ACD5ZGP5_AVESA